MSDLLQKVVDTTRIGAGGGGILNAEQANRFIDYIWDATVLGKEAHTVKMRAPVVDIDKVAVGQRIARVATEGVDDHVNADPTFSKISLTSTKIRLDWELTSEGLEDNIAGDDLEDHVARLMATQLGNDLEDLAINGDSASADALLKAFDGYKKLAFNGGHVKDAAGAALTKAVFNTGVKAMPRKYLQRRTQLRFYTASGPIQDFLNGLTDRSTPLGDRVIFGDPSAPEGSGGPTGIRPFGIGLNEVPLTREDLAGDYSGAAGTDHTYVELTFPKNRIWGIHREIVAYREFKPKKDALEYTVYTRMGVQVENLDSYVVVKNVKVQS